MPNIRIMNWNIEKLSGNKVAIAGMANNIGQAIADSQADIVILLEVTSGTGLAAMAAVSAAANVASVAAGGNANDYTGWLISYATGGEFYGLLIKNLNVVRPIRVTAGPAGDNNTALDNLDRNQFGTWRGPFLGVGAVPNAYAPPFPGALARPRLPLIDVYASLPRRRAAQRGRFAGRNLANGGYALGMGFRMPCLMMFEILNGAANATYLISLLVCHLGAVRGGANRLARGQIRQYKDTHIAQKFMNPQALFLPFGGYIDLNNAARPIQELIITGDFNVDFLQQNPPLPANALRTGNRNALNTITPTTVNGGSAVPAAPPGPPAPYAVMPPHAPLPPPAVPFGVIVGPPGPSFLDIPNLALKTAATTQGTILINYNAGVVPANLAALRGACFDNFFFGGAQLSATFQVLTPAPPAADACQVIDLPAQIVQAGGGGAGALDVSAIQAHYQGLLLAALAAAVPPAPPPPPPPHFHYAYAAPNLAPGAPFAALTTNDQLIGARFISDHLPTVVQFNLP